MRFAILILIMVPLIPISLINPQIGILGYVWFSLVRPDALAWTTLPFSLVLALCVLFSSLRRVPFMLNWVRNPISALLLLQQVPIAVSVVLAVEPQLCYLPYNRYARLIVMALLIPMLIDTEVWLRRLLFTIVLSLGFLAAKFGVFSMIYGGVVLVRGLAGPIGDSNGLALIMAMLFPLAWYAAPLAHKKYLKPACYAICGLALVVVAQTGSRGNAVALGCVLVLVVLRSRYKILGLVTMAITALPVIYFAGQRVAERLSTITAYDQDLSAVNRLTFWKTAILMWKDYPLFGVGYGEKNYIALATKYMGYENIWVVHNTYLQMLVDCGIFEFVLYVLTLWGAIVWLEFSAWRMRRIRPEYAWYPLAVQGSLVAFAVGSTFYSRGEFEFLYTMLMTAASWYLVERKILASAAAGEPVQSTPSPATQYAAPQPTLAIPDFPEPVPTEPAPSPSRGRYKLGGRLARS